MMRFSIFLGCLAYTLVFKLVFLRGDLVINARNQGGELLTEVLSANVSDDTVVLELQKTDGTFITQLTDFRNGASLLRVMVLGEEELSQSGYQVLCFVTRPPALDVIPPEAMSKLRQKNPGTVRIPEEDKGITENIMDAALLPEMALNDAEKHPFGPHLVSLCSEAVNAVYAKEEDVKYWHSQQEAPGIGGWSYVRAAMDGAPACRDVRLEDESDVGCACHLVIPIPWYPCGLKFCPSKDSSGKLVNYRCGIQTCRQSYRFLYRVSQKRLCLWDT